MVACLSLEVRRAIRTGLPCIDDVKTNFLSFEMYVTHFTHITIQHDNDVIHPFSDAFSILELFAQVSVE